MVLASTTELSRAGPLGDEPLYEVVDGQRKELEPMGAIQVLLAFELAYHLRHFARQQGLGVVVTEMLFLLDAQRDLQRRPDVAFVSYPRWPRETVPDEAAWNVVPDLAVEVISPTNRADEVDAKLVDYFAAGVRLVWVVYPESGRVYVYDSPNRAGVLERSDELDGGDVLPGFRLPIETLYEALTRPE